MPDQREVVITGVGVVCPIGVGREPFWRALEAGQSGVGWIKEYEHTDLPFRIAGLIKGFDAKEFVQPRKTIKVMCSEIQAAYASAMLATQDAGLPKGSVPAERMGVVLGSEILYGDVEETGEVFRHCMESGQFDFSRWGDFAFKDLFPLWMLKYLPNMAACHISIACDAHGPNNSIVEGGASSLLALNEATMVIQRGHADVMLAGGSGSTASIGCLPFRGWEHLSQWPGDPTGASRPFDARRSGIVPGEGSAVFVLEDREHAERRGAKILARLLGFASRYEACTHGQPFQGTAIRQSIVAALASAGVSPDEIGHVNAHGDGGIEHDRVEALAIRETLGDVPVTAPKSYFGDLSAGSGAVEMAASVLGLAHGQIPPTLNYETFDPACPV
ncbi:MAG: beta-ketoacyl-[acyl-carrier-protein] synthase family protein, partial [Pirellulaceae bacterium]|nr:beta-ketoacyl-[acyl-carrier-protein] synthase family protein [Pirellulaceae bacterium]